MTQTTDERIRELLLDSLNILDGTFRSTQATDIASQIAAEIDGLRDELAVILRERNDAHLALAERTRERDEARTEVERLRPAAEAWEAQVEEERMSYRYLRGWESAEARSEAEVRAKSARARAAK